MDRLIVPNDIAASLRVALLGTGPLEQLAVLFAGRRRGRDGWRLLAREAWLARGGDYRIQEAFHLEMEPGFWARVAKRARTTGESPVIVHTHPFDAAPPSFSPSDDWGERQLVPKLRSRAPVPIGTIVLSPGGSQGRLHDPEQRPLAIGSPWTFDAAAATADPRYERQVRALGRSGQARLRSLTVGVVGVGGTGSHVVQQLVHLGIGRLLVVDPDHVERTNLSRVVGAIDRDAASGRSKTVVAARIARGLGSGTRIDQIRASVTDDAVARQLGEADVVFGCTDTQWSRLVLNALAHQHYVPVIDVGVELTTRGGMGGRVTILGPDDGCLWCLGVLSEERLRNEQLTGENLAAQRAAGYIADADVPQPAVVSINGVLASLAVTEFLDRVTGFRGDVARPGMLVYRLGDATVRRVSVAGRSCAACRGPTAGAGDLARLPTMQPTLAGAARHDLNLVDRA